MGGVVSGKEFDSKVIYIEGEGGRWGGVGPKTRGVFHRSVSMGLEVAYKAFVGNDAGLLESVHPLYDPYVDIATCVSDGEELLFNDHLVWDVFEMDLHVMEVGN